MKFINPKDGHRLDKAVTFLVTNYTRTGANPKPVIFHGLNVAIYLLNYGYDIDLVEAAILHDLIEDSEVTREDITLSFGEKIATWVDALSFKTSIEDKEERYKEMFERIKKAGREVLIIKCADIYANSFYIKLVEDLGSQRFLVDKLKYFLNLSQDLIGEEPVWRDLFNQSIVEEKRLSGC